MGVLSGVIVILLHA